MIWTASTLLLEHRTTYTHGASKREWHARFISLCPLRQNLSASSLLTIQWSVESTAPIHVLAISSLCLDLGERCELILIPFNILALRCIKLDRQSHGLHHFDSVRIGNKCDLLPRLSGLLRLHWLGCLHRFVVLSFGKWVILISALSCGLRIA